MWIVVPASPPLSCLQPLKWNVILNHVYNLSGLYTNKNVIDSIIKLLKDKRDFFHLYLDGVCYMNLAELQLRGID